MFSGRRCLKPLLYLVFEVHLRLHKLKTPFQPPPVNTPCLTFPLKPLSDKGFSICVCPLFPESASNPYSNCITAPKINPSIFTPSNRRIFAKKFSSIALTSRQQQFSQYYQVSSKIDQNYFTSNHDQNLNSRNPRRR